MENVDIFYSHLEYFMHISDILWTFGTFCVLLVPFFRFWYHEPRKIWQPWSRVKTLFQVLAGAHNLKKLDRSVQVCGHILTKQSNIIFIKLV
jgi:hypothetical protein